MRAVRLHRFGQPMQLDDIDRPERDADLLTLGIRFIATNPIDLWLTRGAIAGGRQRLPFVVGAEATGNVEGRPALVHGAGLGVTRDGLYAEAAVVPAEAVHYLPAEVDLAHAAAVGIPGSTAWLLIHEVARVNPSDRVLILGSSGGVGSLLIQLARNLGCVVWAHTSTSSKAKFVAALAGGNAVVATATTLAAAVADLQPTLVFDPLGDGYTAALIAALPPEARIILFGTSVGATGELDLRLMYKKSISIQTYSGATTPSHRTHEATTRMVQELAAGRIRVTVDAVMPLAHAQEAHDRLRRGEVTGKLLLQP